MPCYLRKKCLNHIQGNNINCCLLNQSVIFESVEKQSRTFPNFHGLMISIIKYSNMSPLSIFILKFMINLIIKFLNMCSLVNHQQKEGINVIPTKKSFHFYGCHFYYEPIFLY